MSMDRNKRDVTPITDDGDREVYFAVRKIFSGEDVDEKTFDTTSYTSSDMYAYLIMHGYKNEPDRLNFAINAAKQIIDMRAKYGLKPTFEAEYWLPKWKFSIPLKDFQKEWKSCCYGRSSSGTLVCWDTIGNVKYEFLQRLETTPDGWESASHYVVRNVENSFRIKLMLAKERGYRITYKYTVVDVSNVGFTTFNAIRGFLQKVTADVATLYPEAVKRSFLINSGWVFQASWKIIKQFLHRDTVAKIAVWGSDYKRRLKDVGITDIPTFMGGTCNDYVLGVDNIFTVDSKTFPRKGIEEESKAPPIELEAALDNNKTRVAKTKLEVSNIEDIGPSDEDIKMEFKLEASK